MRTLLLLGIALTSPAVALARQGDACDKKVMAYGQEMYQMDYQGHVPNKHPIKEVDLGNRRISVLDIDSKAKLDNLEKLGVLQAGETAKSIKETGQFYVLQVYGPGGSCAYTYLVRTKNTSGSDCDLVKPGSFVSCCKMPGQKNQYDNDPQKCEVLRKELI